MAESSPKTTKKTKTTKTTTKPKTSKTTTAKSVKTPSSKLAKTTTTKSPKTTVAKTTKNTKATSATTKTKNPAKPIFIAIIIIAVLAVLAGVIGCVINKCINNDIVMIDNGKGEEIKAQRVGLENYDYTIAVPTDFEKLSDEKIKEIYGTTEAPELAYANPDDTVQIVFSAPNNTLKDEQIAEYLNAMKLILSTSMEVLDSNTYEVDGHNVATLKVLSENDGEKIYNQMLFFSYDDKLAIISFNCKDSVRGDWETAGDNILKTLKINK